MLAVHGSPWSGSDAGRHPQPESEEVAHNRMQIKRSMCLAAVQVDRHADDGDVCQHQRNQ